VQLTAYLDQIVVDVLAEQLAADREREREREEEAGRITLC